MSGVHINDAVRDGNANPSDEVWFPERIACSLDGRTCAYVVVATRAGATDQAGIWIGALDAAPARLTDDVPTTNLALNAGDSGNAVIAYAVENEGASELVIRNPNRDVVERHRLEGTAEVVAWDGNRALLVLLAEAGADTASLSSGTPLSTEAPLARSNQRPIGWRRIWRLDAETMTPSALSSEGVTVWEFVPIGDGTVVAIVSTDPSEAGWYRPVLTVLGPTPSSRHDLHVATWQISCPTVSPDGARIASLEGWTSDRGLGTGRIRVIEIASGAISEVTSVTGVDITWLQWTADDQLWFAGWQGLGMTWGSVASPGTNDETAHVRHELASLVNSRWHPQVVPFADARALTVHSTVTEPPKVSLIDDDGGVVRWSTLNAEIGRERGILVQEVRWRSKDVELEGLLALPRDRVGPLALVVNIHGGPTLSYHHSWELSWAETVTGAGYALFLPNIYGGPGRGQAFARMNLGDPAGLEFDQILDGVRHLSDAGLADVERVVAMGASYGGYLTASAVARGELFRGGVVTAGMSNLQSCWGTANNAPFYNFLCGGSPNERRALYEERSPVNVVTKRSLPTLILHGELDQCVPISQARELFATLTSVNVPAELVVYPGEGHQIKRIEHVRDQHRRIVAFLDALL